MRVVKGGYATLAQREESMEQFARFLAAQLHQPVTDATGLTAKYDISLRWVMESAIRPDDDPGPNLFQAIQQQLGLKLESRKGTVEILVVDHLEKTPSEN